MQLGAEILIESLRKENVRVIFGYPGGAALKIFDALKDATEIRTILVRHEQGAAHAANGYARASGKVGVCMATSGPGATNLVTGIATAYMDSIPIVAITGQVATSMVGTDAFQEVDITGITDPIVKHNYLVQEAGDIPRIIKEAFYIAQSGRPGPVLIDIPQDVTAAMAENIDCKKVDLRGYKPNINGHIRQIKQVIELIEKAERPLICAGGGVNSARATEELLYMVENAGIPVTTTMMGRGSISQDHPLALGMLGTYGLAAANMAVQACDLFIALGMRFGDRVTGATAKFAPHAKIVHIDIDAAEIGKNMRVDVPLVGDLKVVLGQLNKRLQAKENQPWRTEIAEIKAKYRAKDRPVVGSGKDEEGGTDDTISAADVIENLNQRLTDDCIVTTDVGQHQIWAAQKIRTNLPGKFISSGGLGTMGYGIPAAVGAQVACPDCNVYVITGDGSFQMGMPELGTALEQGLPLKIILINNQTLGMVKQLQDHYCQGRYSSTEFSKSPDFHHLALAFGALSLRVAKRQELAYKMEQFVQHRGMAIMEVVVPARENVYPIVLTGSGLDEMVGT